MAERLVTQGELQVGLEAILGRVEAGETVVVVADQPGAAPPRRVVLVSAATYDTLVPPSGHGHDVEAAVGGVAGGLVAGAGTTLSSLTGRPEMAKGARKLGRRLGRALAAGMDAMHPPDEQRRS